MCYNKYAKLTLYYKIRKLETQGGIIPSVVSPFKFDKNADFKTWWDTDFLIL